MSDLYSGLRPDEFDLLAQLKERLLILEQGCPPFIVPEGSEAGSDDEFENGWDHAYNSDTKWEKWGYRLCDGELEFKGHLMPGTSGTVAFTLPADYYQHFSGNPSWPTHIVVGATYARADVELDVTTGAITITY